MNSTITKVLINDSCSFEKGGVPPKFVIIDDGWQSVAMDPTGLEFKADNTAK